MLGRYLNERLGKIHFWLTFVGVYCIFVPMHWLVLVSHAQAVSEGSRELLSHSRFFVSVAALLTVAAQGVFFFNFVWSLVRGEAAENSPWRASTLEWSLPSPPTLDNFGGQPGVYREAYELNGEDFVPQNAPPRPAESRGRDCAAQPRFSASFPESAAS